MQKAIACIPRLRMLLEQLPEDIDAIVHAEALAIYHELLGDKEQALIHRKQEMALMEKLHADVEENTFDPETAAAVLKGRGLRDLQVRSDIVDKLRSL